ncbi:MAG: hypothetical protein N3C12_06370 [Candidatus Binatia bacterium]|nr:hypothetical protein [Candidatus Binatia bacterium]
MPEANQWRIPPERFDVRTICVLPIDPEVKELEPGAENLRRIAVEELERAGFGVVPISKEGWKTLADRAAADVGGVFDPEVGWLDVDRVEEARQRFNRSVGKQYRCDASLALTIHVVRAPWRDGVAKWDGSEETIANYLLTIGDWGWVMALSLHARLVGANSEELYFCTGGLRTLGKYNPLAAPFAPPFQPVKAEELLSPELVSHRAVLLALGLLLAARGRGSTPGAALQEGALRGKTARHKQAVTAP